MKTQTRRGLKIILNQQQFVRQEQIELGHETYYIIYRQDGSYLELNSPLPSLEINLIDKRAKPTPQVQSTITYQSTPLLKAEDCPSVSEGNWCPVKLKDEYASEKYKGEIFFTHKTSPGLIIKTADGNIRHDTKMSDMHKRRD